MARLFWLNDEAWAAIEGPVAWMIAGSSAASCMFSRPAAVGRTARANTGLQGRSITASTAGPAFWTHWFQTRLADADAVAHGLAVLHDEIEEAGAGIDDDRSRRLLRYVVDHLANVARVHVLRIDSGSLPAIVGHRAIHPGDARVDWWLGRGMGQLWG